MKQWLEQLLPALAHLALWKWPRGKPGPAGTELRRLGSRLGECQQEPEEDDMVALRYPEEPQSGREKPLKADQAFHFQSGTRVAFRVPVPNRGLE